MPVLRNAMKNGVALKSSLMALFAVAMVAACGPANVQLRPSNSCDSSPDGLKLCRDQCDNNQARSCYRVGWFYETGQEVSQSTKTAIDHYKRACDLNFATACRALGDIYWNGQDVDRNPKAGIDYYRKACKLGVPEACPTMAMIARSEGRRPKPGEDRAVEAAAGYAPNAPDAPDAPDAPEVNTPQTPSVETPKTPSIDVSGPSLN